MRTVAALLAACVLFGSARVLVAERPPAPERVLRFGPGTSARVAALRDRLAFGLLSLRLPGNDWSPRPNDVDVHPIERREATALAVAALGAARRMGSSIPSLEEALFAGKAEMVRVRRRGRELEVLTVEPNRNLKIRGIATQVLAMSLVDDPADVSKWPRAVETLLGLMDIGPPLGGWSHGTAVRALGEMIESGRSSLLGADPRATIPVRPTQTQRDCQDPRVAAALAAVFRGTYDEAGPSPADVLDSCLATPLEWGGEQTDMRTWLMRAWLAARLPGGERWLRAVLPILEAAPNDRGVVEGTFYGDPTSRTASALLILYEGWRLGARSR